MTIDLDNIPQLRRRKLTSLGEQFGSQDTLDQANQTLGAYKKHAAALQTAGFGPKQAKELEDARDGLVAAGVGREAAKGKKKTSGKAFVTALNEALTARLTSRAVLAGVQEDLEGSEAPEMVATEHEVAVALAQTSAAPDKAEPVAQQLSQLLTALKLPVVVAQAAEQGGPDAVAKAEAAITALRKADQEDVGTRGTPVETETLDLLDGIIVQLVRRARRAAQAAAKATGNAALLDEFRLDKLYRARGGRPPEDDDDEDEEEKGK